MASHPTADAHVLDLLGGDQVSTPIGRVNDDKSTLRLISSPTQSVIEDSDIDVSLVADDVLLQDMDLKDLMDRFSQDERVKKALADGVDLREYARQVDEELSRTQREAVLDYASQADNFAEVHAQIRTCDSILEQMETLLSGFQTNLGAISSEIRYLQEESTTLSVKLSNRQAVSSKVSDFVRSTVIPEDMARDICEAQVNEAYLEYLTELNKRMDFTSSMQKGGKTPPLAVAEVTPVLQKLEIKAVERVREFLLQRIHALRKPRTNLQMIQHNVLSKFKYMNMFLQSHSWPVFEEVQALYVETLSKIYGNYFKAYLGGLAQLESTPATKYDLLGVEPEKQKSWLDRFSTTTRTVNVFGLGQRAVLLDDVGADAIVAHEASERKLKFSYEAIFRSVNQYLIDSVTSEWLFCIEWFGPNDLFGRIFNIPLQQCLQSITTSVRSSFDCVSLLIMMRINSINKRTMVRRGIPVLVPYFQKMDGLILPRLLEVLAANVQSVQQFTIPPGTIVELRPHFIVRRYAELVTALCVLTQEYKHPDVLTAMNQLREVMVALIDRLALSVQAGPKERARKQQIFTITNIDLILGLLREKEVVATEVVILEEKMEKTIDQFVQAQLMEFFSPLFNFVKSASGGKTVDKESTEAVIKSIHKTWKGDVQRLCQSVLQNGFSNFSLAGAICRKLLFELTKCNTKCWDIIKETFGPNAFTKFYLAPFQLKDEFSNAMKSLGLLLEI